MSDLGWRAQSSQLSREAKAIEGLRGDFGVRVRAAVETLKEEGGNRTANTVERQKGRLALLKNKGVEERSQRDLEQLETDEIKEQKRLAALERKAALYESLCKGVDLDDEEANDMHEVDFIAKSLLGHGAAPDEPASSVNAVDEGAAPRQAPLHPEEIIQRQQAIRRQMQGGGKEEYSTYKEDLAELEARHRKVDELNELNAQREAEFEAAREAQAAREEKRQKDKAKHKALILQQLLRKRQKLK